jgi:hypothetical protein
VNCSSLLYSIVSRVELYPDRVNQLVEARESPRFPVNARIDRPDGLPTARARLRTVTSGEGDDPDRTVAGLGRELTIARQRGLDDLDP